MSTEVWKDIKGYEGIYQISDLGRVRSFYNKRWGFLEIPTIMTPSKGSKGYSIIGLHKSNKRKTKRISRLVAEAFLDRPTGKDQVNHINGDKADNSAENLEWCSCKENIHHAINNKLFREAPKGELNPSAKLNEKQVRVIKHLFYIKPKMMIGEIASIFGQNKSAIYDISNKRSWKHIKV